jgi:hypothetical protein
MEPLSRRSMLQGIAGTAALVVPAMGHAMAAGGDQAMKAEPFWIEVPERVIGRIQDRVANVHLPITSAGAGWQ